EPGNQAKNSTLATTTRAKNADEFTFFMQVFDYERDILDGGVCVRLVDVIDLGYATKLNHRWTGNFCRSADMFQHFTHADGMSGRRGGVRGGLGSRLAHDFVPGFVIVVVDTDAAGRRRNTAVTSSHVCSRLRTA